MLKKPCLKYKMKLSASQECNLDDLGVEEPLIGHSETVSANIGYTLYLYRTVVLDNIFSNFWMCKLQ